MNTTVTILGEQLPSIPWEDRPAGCSDPVWRSGHNPIITRKAVQDANSIFNSAVVPWQGEFIGVFRIDHRDGIQRLHVGRSLDGLGWTINADPIVFKSSPAGLPAFEYGYDPRLCRIGDRFYVTWCNGFQGEPTIGMAWTTDFVDFHQLENAFLPYNRNGVLFPRRIGGQYLMLSRPSDPGHTPFGNIYLSASPDLEFWGRHRLVMKPNKYSWQSKKVGAAPIPVAFPVASLQDPATGHIAIYYGAADTSTCLAYAQVDELVAYIKANSDV